MRGSGRVRRHIALSFEAWRPSRMSRNHRAQDVIAAKIDEELCWLN